MDFLNGFRPKDPLTSLILIVKTHAELAIILYHILQVDSNSKFLTSPLDLLQRDSARAPWRQAATILKPHATPGTRSMLRP